MFSLLPFTVYSEQDKTLIDKCTSETCYAIWAKLICTICTGVTTVGDSWNIMVQNV